MRRDFPLVGIALMRRMRRRRMENWCAGRSIVNQSSGHLEDVSALYAVYGKKKEADQGSTSRGTSRITAARLGGETAGAHPSDSKISIAELLGHVKGRFDDVMGNLNYEKSCRSLRQDL